MSDRGFIVPNAVRVLDEWPKAALLNLFRPPIKRIVPVRTPTISVIIPAHNEEAYLERTLSAIRRQNYGAFEVLVIANGCNDRTVGVARDHCDRLVVLSQKSLGIARNLGARLARGELLVFLDADTSLEPMALRRIAQDFTPGDAAGTTKGRPQNNRWAYRFLYSLKNFLHRWSLHPGSSGVIICWKTHFMKVGGFDEGLELRENSDLMKRLMPFGRYRFVPDISATTSMRRYERHGLPRVVWLWWRIWIQSCLGDLRRKHYEAVR